jgi:hypothetical protein
MDNKAQLAEKLKGSNNVLVTVSNSPSVDQLAACIGMTLWLNKMGKHATAVFSGDIPNTLEFLKPEETLEKNTDSLRDFIIALDKSKADKLRYKVEDRVVKIFITPYRTSLSADDLEFSQGDFNIDAIVAIGVTKQEDLDQAITSHGRILHDAVVVTINTSESGDIGSINWRDSSSSSLCELVYDLCQVIDAKQLDPQIATALLTGIVAETNRFSNDRTTPNTMSTAAALMGAGANQQLVANKLADNLSQVKPNTSAKSDDGTLQIGHSEESAPIDSATNEANSDTSSPIVNKRIDEPPLFDGQLTANSVSENELEPSTDPFSLPPIDTAQLLSREPLTPITSEPQPSDIPKVPPAPGPLKDLSQPYNVDSNEDDQTLSDIEQSVNSPHLTALQGQVNQVPETTTPNPTEINNQPLEFNPSNFDIDDDKYDPLGAPPPVPPPIISPDFLPPAPPASR